ncbi:MAG TPA: sugar ABC transporter permease [Gammaproteobacteria bacterium]|nr:sugar ABC transporter permease [Gammaproteobacteria bacterium]
MTNPSPPTREGEFVVPPDEVPAGRKTTGRIILWAASLLLVGLALVQTLYAAGAIAFGFATWRPVLYAYGVWGVALGVGQVLTRGEKGYRALFVLPAALFTLAVAVFPTLFALYIATLDWNLSSVSGPHFAGLDNFIQMFHDAYYWNALGNMLYYLAAVFVEYAIAFALALLLNAEIRARKFFRVAFLLPFMLSPVAVSWMIGKSLMEYRFGPAARLARDLGWQTPAFFADPWTAWLSIEAMDAWMWIPFMVILLLAGLQGLSREVLEAAKVDGASGWQAFWRVIFPLMLPVSITTVMIRVIFKFKLADIVINVTSGGPGGATDTVSSFIYRVYRDRSNVGYGTALAIFYLVLIIALLLFLLKWSNRFRRNVT